MPNDKPKLWGSSGAYERYMGRWSRKVAPPFLDWLDPLAQMNWADIGCGTGVLTSLVADRYAPAALTGIDAAEPLISAAKQSHPDIGFHVGDALNLDIAENTLDYAISALLLNFLPDQLGFLSEMHRVLRPGGTAALYVWDYAGHMQIMRYFFDAARELDVKSMDFDDGINAPICRPQPLREAFDAAGFVNIETTAIDIPTPFANFDDYWAPFLGGTGSAPKYCASLDKDLRGKIRDSIRARLPTGPDGEILLAARAWAVSGRVPE